MDLDLSIVDLYSEWKIMNLYLAVNGLDTSLIVSNYTEKVKVPVLVIKHRGPELIPDSRQSACR